MRRLPLLLLLLGGCLPSKNAGTGTETDADTDSDIDSDSDTDGSAPSAPVVAIEPSGPSTLEDLTVVILTASEDPDGDTVAYSYAWYQEDVLRDDLGDTTSVPASATTRDEAWRVVVTPTDGTHVGEPGEASTVVLDSAPSEPAISVEPSAPAAGVDDLVCRVVTASVDEDGDAVAYTFSWTVDGVPYETGGGTVSGGVYGGWDGAASNDWPGDSVPVRDIRAGQEWVCSVVAAGGTGSSAPVSVARVITDPGLIAHWPLERGSARDETANGLDGTVSGATVGAGQVGDALHFDGVDDRVSFGTTDLLHFDTAMTVAAWVYSDAANEYGAILTRRSCCLDATDFEWSLQTSVGEVRFGYYGESGLYWSPSVELASRRWTLFVGVYDGASVSLYQDGILVATTTASGALVERDFEVMLGARDHSSGYSDFWSGGLDEVRVWDRDLLPEEVEQIYDAEK